MRYGPRVRRLPLAIALAGLLAFAPAAAAKAPSLTDLEVYRDSAGPGRGSLVIVGDADFTRAVAGARNRIDPGAHALLTVSLHANGRTLLVSDTARLTRSHHQGAPVRLHITVSPVQARTLGSVKRVRASAWLDRIVPATSRRTAAPRGMWQELCEQLDEGADGMPVPCPIPVQFQPAPPAPPVGFEVWQGGTGDSLWEGASEALICVRFMGSSGYANPSWYSIGINTPTSSVGYGWTQASQMDVPATGTSVESSYYDTWPTGYANVVSGPTLTVTVPTSILSGPVSSRTGSATLVASPGFPGTSGTWTLPPLPAASAAGVC